EGAPGGEELLGAPGGSDSEQCEEGRLDPSPLLRVGDVLRQNLCHLRPGRSLSVRLCQAAPGAHHLSQRPEGDPLAVGRAPPVMPPDVLNQPIEVLEEFPCQPALPDPRRTDDRYQSGPPLATGS